MKNIRFTLHVLQNTIKLSNYEEQPIRVDCSLQLNYQIMKNNRFVLIVLQNTIKLSNYEEQLIHVACSILFFT